MAAAHLVAGGGARIPAIGLGTWPMKGRDCADAVAAALGMGYRHVDTAAMYANEDAVGEGLRASGVPRDAVFVTTKIWHENLARDAALRSAEASLRRLRLDAVDLLLIHWPDRSMDVAAMVAGLAACRAAGLARHVGVSNFPAAMLAEAVQEAAQQGCGPLAANQCEFHPRLDQSRLIAACRAAGTAFVAYAPLGTEGLLDDPGIAEIARAHGRSPGQVVLRWHVQQPGVVAIPKSASPVRLAQNLAVFDFALTAAQMQSIHALARLDGRKVSPTFAPAWDAAG